MRGQLLQCYREGSSEGFRDHLLRGIKIQSTRSARAGSVVSIRFSCCKLLSERFARRCSSISRGGRTGVMATTTQARPGSRAPRSPYYDPNAEAKIFLAILGAVFLAAVFYIAYARLHFRLVQLIEISFYLVALFIVIWDFLRYAMTYQKDKETSWPHPPLTVVHKNDERFLQAAFKENSIVIGYDVHGQPCLWPDEVRVMQSNAFGMTGSGKTTLLMNILAQDLVRMAGPKERPHKIPLIVIDGKGEREFLDDKLLPLVAAAGRLDDLRIIDPHVPRSACASTRLLHPVRITTSTSTSFSNHLICAMISSKNTKKHTCRTSSVSFITPASATTFTTFW